MYRRLRRAPAVRLPAGTWLWLCGAILAGGIVGPVLLMFGLAGMPASGASLLLNAESVFTALLAWFAFRENFDRRIALGMVALYGASDEFHLSFVPTRVASGWDVVIDACGGALGLTLLWGYGRWRIQW